jgi:predicted ATPase
MATAEITRTDKDDAQHMRPPFLRRVRIHGYRSIAFCDVTLEPLTVLVGRNGSGKSNFLDALAFLRDVVVAGPTDAVMRHGGWRSLYCRTANSDGIEFNIEATLLPTSQTNNGASGDLTPRDRRISAKYQLKIMGNDFGPPILGHELLECFNENGQNIGRFEVDRESSNGEAKLITDFLNLNGKGAWMQGLVRPNLCRLGALAIEPIMAVADGVLAMGFYNPRPEVMRLPQNRPFGGALEQDGGNVTNIIRLLQETHPSILNRVKLYLAYITGTVEDFSVQGYGNFDMVHFMTRIQSGDPALDFDASNMSDGTLRVLCNLLAVFQVVPPHGHRSVVGIEEPETSLHPAAMQALVEALDEATSFTQVIITTHSAELLDNPTIKPEAVRVVEMIDGQTTITPIDDASLDIVKRDLNTLGGLERDNLLELNLGDLERQRQLQQAQEAQ